MIEYSFQRLVLLNSAGYQRAELPLDDSVSLIAPNNTGKTSLINALQFMLIIDQRRMDFGAHKFDKTRHFYFPHNSSYILLEVNLPKTGTVVFGCVGKGVSHEYEYFAYKGSLLIEQYRLQNGTLIAQPQLIEHMANHGRSVYKYNPAEYRDLIYGGRRRYKSDQPDFTVFKLDHASDAQAFQQVLTRTLRLDKLNSTEVKNYLLQIFKRDLPDANIDFKQEWDKAFAEVNTEREQYVSALKQENLIKQLKKDYQERLILRGKLIDWRPRIEQGLQEWQAYYEQSKKALQTEQQQLREQQKNQTSKIKQLAREMAELEQQQNTLQQEQKEQSALEDKFTLIPNRRSLEQQVVSLKQQRDRLITQLEQVQGRSESSIQRELARRERELQQWQQQLDNLDDNLYQHLSKGLTQEQLDTLNRLLSGSVMTLGSAHFSLNVEVILRTLKQQGSEQLQLPGLTLELDLLTPQHQQLTASELQEQLEDSQKQLRNLQEQLDVARQLTKTEEKKQAIEKEIKELERDLESYDRLHSLKGQAPKRQDKLAEIQLRMEKIDHHQSNLDQIQQQLNEQINNNSVQQNQLEQRHKRIDEVRNKRKDHGEAFQYLDKQEHHPWLAEPDWEIEQLADKLHRYQQDCQELLELNHALNTGLSQLHSGGLTKFQYSDSADNELQFIFNFSEQLPKEREALEKKARSAVINVTSSLRDLRSGLDSFKNRMHEFNRLISHRQLSDLKVFKIEPRDEQLLVEAIDLLIDTASEVESGESFELFNQNSVLDDVKLDRARQILIDEGNVRQGLRVDDLFRLEFVVAKQDQAAESFQDIDSAASNGTVLMAKLVTGLAMLYLMQDKRHQVQAICYLDEALALDAKNQHSLINTAQEFGFALIFASPAPLTTARYCVPIVQEQGKNHISRQSWQILEPLDSSEPAVDISPP